MAEIQREPEPNTLRNTEISTEEMPSNKAEGRTLEQEEIENLVRRISELAVKVEGGVVLEPGEKILWNIRLVAKMTPEQQRALFEQKKRYYIFSGRDYKEGSDNFEYNVSRMIKEGWQVLSLSPQEIQRILKLYDPDYWINNQESAQPKDIFREENHKWGDDAFKKILEGKYRNFKSAYANANVSRTIKKDENGFSLSATNIEVFDNDNESIFFKGEGIKSNDDAVKIIIEQLKGEETK